MLAARRQRAVCGLPAAASRVGDGGGDRKPCELPLISGSASGFDCVNDDPSRSRIPGAAGAYREGHRVLRPGGLILNESRIYGDNSKTAAYLESLGCANASRESLGRLWAEIGLEIVSETYLNSHRGKSEPGDGLPIEESDEWHVMAWVLRKR